MGKNVLLRSLLVLLIGILSGLPMTVHAAEYGTQEVNKLAIPGGTSDTATLAVTVDDGTINVTVPVQLDAAAQNTAEAVAQKIADTLGGNAQISDAYTVSVSGRDVLLTAKTAAENKNVSISTAEVASGIKQVEATIEKDYINKGVAPKEATKAHHVLQWNAYTNNTEVKSHYLIIYLGDLANKTISFDTPGGPCYPGI